MERILILIAEAGGAGAVLYGLFFYLFKNAFGAMIDPLSKAIDRLGTNVDNMTRTISSHQVKIEQLEDKVDGHETRITVIEHDHLKGEHQ
ncbi:hypothetical protein [Leuconostoc lactis]|uniref:hypothetical protein n=1 Tax=Leuconostoc lactis TaxID=1246 RepID=UPI00241D8919|nr:hypothetical protein [Leuconostoc lactis]